MDNRGMGLATTVTFLIVYLYGGAIVTNVLPCHHRHPCSCPTLAVETEAIRRTLMSQLATGGVPNVCNRYFACNKTCVVDAYAERSAPGNVEARTMVDVNIVQLYCNTSTYVKNERGERLYLARHVDVDYTNMRGERRPYCVRDPGFGQCLQYLSNTTCPERGATGHVHAVA